MKKSKRLLLVAIAVLVIALVCGWHAVGKHRAIHADIRTPYMVSCEETAPNRVLTSQELLQEPVKQQTLTLHRAVYYPQAETLVCFVEGLNDYRDYYIEPLADAPSFLLSKSYGISTMIFESISTDAVAGPLIIELTDPQFESSNPVSFPLG